MENLSQYQNMSSTQSMAFSDSSAAMQQMLKITEDLRSVYEKNNETKNAVNEAHHEVLMRLAIAAEYRDEDTGNHIIRVGYMAENLCKLLGESDEYCQMIRLAAPMHDVGKIGIPDSILKSPNALSPEEREIMNKHAEIGYKILANSSVPLFKLAATIALTHHEKYDGSGYPNKLMRNFIPLAGRVVALIDYFDALTMDRCYRKAFTDDKAIEMIIDQSGKHFDPNIVEVFLENIHTFIEIRERVNKDPFKYSQLIDYSLETFM
jgi:putative two-component system response regulator